MIQNYINHIALVVDKSGSMCNLSDTVVQVFDKEIGYLRKRSVELKQETRISVYLFNESVECLVFDMDVMRMPSLADQYYADGGTALIDATLKSITDMERLPELYGDHAFLIYTLTDGEENRSRNTSEILAAKLKHLKDNWTIVCMVPNARGLHEAKKFGFPSANTQVWSTTSSGVEQVGKEFRSAMDNYMVGRSKGQRGTKNFFQTDLSSVQSTTVQSNLSELSPTVYSIFNVYVESPIKEFVETWTKSGYVSGSAYYELMKPETIQSYKEVCIQNRQNGKIYGGKSARDILSLPVYDVKVKPGDHGDWRIFVQSTSVNRKLIKGTLLLVRK